MANLLTDVAGSNPKVFRPISTVVEFTPILTPSSAQQQDVIAQLNALDTRTGTLVPLCQPMFLSYTNPITLRLDFDVFTTFWASPTSAQNVLVVIFVNPLANLAYANQLSVRVRTMFKVSPDYPSLV